MIFYLTLKTNKELKNIPHIDAVDAKMDGQTNTYHWDETDASIEGNKVYYRFKGISFLDERGNEEYANGILKQNSKFEIEEILWQETDEPEAFEYEIEEVTIVDNGIKVNFKSSEYSFEEKLDSAPYISYKGVVFDDWTVDEEFGGVYGEVCECCANKYKEVFKDELSSGGMGACSLKGCSNVGADMDSNEHYYIDFKPELVKFVNVSEKEMEEGKSLLETKILVAENKVSGVAKERICKDPGRESR